MNTVLGVVIVLLGGQLDDAMVVGVYPSMEACRVDVSAKIESVGPPPAGYSVGRLCVDLSGDLKKLKKAKPAPGSTKI